MSAKSNNEYNVMAGEGNTLTNTSKRQMSAKKHEDDDTSLSITTSSKKNTEFMANTTKNQSETRAFVKKQNT